VINSWTVDELYERLGKPSKIAISLDNEDDLPLSPPQYAILPIDVVKLWVLCAENPTVHIINFGESWICSEPGSPLPAGRETPGTARKVAPPEILVIQSFDDVGAASDVWTLTCTVFELFGDRSLFSMMFGDLNELIGDIVAVLGKLPDRWWKPWTTGRGFGRNWYTDAGEPKGNYTKGRLALNLEERVRTVRGMEEEEYLDEGDRRVLVKMLKAALKLEPKERATALELLAMLPAEWEEGKAAGGTS